MLGAWLASTGWPGGGPAPAEGPLPAPTASFGWKAELPRFGNASPVRAGAHVCVTIEPTTLACFDAATGAERWRYPHEVIATLPVAEQGPLAVRLAEADTISAQLRGWQAARSAAQRAARAGDATAAAEVTTLTHRLAEADRVLRDLAWARTPDDKDVLGYATPTPVTDGRSIWAFFTNGVAAQHALDGRLLWSRWLGPPQANMRGFHTGEAASPLLVDGLLVIAHADLIALDAGTGEERWRRPGWNDYGTPALLRVGGTALLATPNGQILRAADGAVLAQDLGDVWYVGPTAVGDTVVWLGSNDPESQQRAAREVGANAVRLTFNGSTLNVQPLWRTALRTADTFYTSPIVHEGRVYSFTRSGELRVLDLGTGALLHEADLLPKLGGWLYATPRVVDGALVLLSASGRLLTVGLTPPFAISERALLGGTQHRSTPAFAAGRMWVRWSNGLGCVGCD